MPAVRRPLVAGNWKMNGSRAALAEIGGMAQAFDAGLRSKIDLLVCPPVPLLWAAAKAALGTGIAVGAQDCHARTSGAHTGDVSAEMLADVGATAVIVGHSERRADHGEKDQDVRAKAEAVRRAALTAIVCVGETRDEREAGKTLAVVRRQLRGSIPEGSTAAGLVVAYEPVWALQRGRADGGRERRRRAGRRREPQGLRFHGHRRRLPLNGPWRNGAGIPIFPPSGWRARRLTFVRPGPSPMGRCRPGLSAWKVPCSRSSSSSTSSWCSASWE